MYKTTLCRICKEKQNARNEGKITLLAYMKWFIAHELAYPVNHSRGAAAMEQAGVVALYECSKHKKHLYYDPFIGDGDSSAHPDICRNQVYGPTKIVSKKEDIRHITKRMGKAFRLIIRD